MFPVSLQSFRLSFFRVSLVPYIMSSSPHVFSTSAESMVAVTIVIMV